ncbi:MAG: Signal transduction response regulator [Promethearchaeota archaeon]|nr:MAG: Signal transduction response regulator [Candidatus Lokiarchaeota archaeon]
MELIIQEDNSEELTPRVDNVEEYIRKLEDGDISEKTKEMEEYEKETGRYAIWRNVVTESFKRWLKGEKIYNRDKERISLYVTDKTKSKWQNFIKDSNYSTISKLIRNSVKTFIEDFHKKEIDQEISKINPKTVSNISHALKEPLTSIKGYSQLLIENHSNKLNENVLETIRNIFDQSILLENKIIKFLDNIKQPSQSPDILLIEDDLATIRLITSYFESKGYNCKGVVSGSKGIEELKNSTPKVILLDIILPDLSGYDICKTIKSDNDYKSIPVFFLTAIAGSEVEKKLDETKADGYILKPFNFSDFEEIFEILNNKSS